MNIQITYDLTELNKKAKFCLELSDLTEEEALNILKYANNEISYVELVASAVENKINGVYKDANTNRIG